MTIQQEATYRQLSTRADQADERFYATVRARLGREWWQVKNREIQASAECREAFREKQSAAEALLAWVRTGKGEGE